MSHAKIRALRVARGLSQRAFGRLIGVSDSAVAQWEMGDTKPSPEHIAALARVLNVDWSDISDKIPLASPNQSTLPVLGTIEAGTWREVMHQVTGRRVRIAPDERWPSHYQFALIISGNSLNKLAHDGAIITCLDIGAGVTPHPGNLVYVERIKQDGTYEYTVRRLKMGNNGLELWPESTDKARQKPISLEETDGITVTIRGIVTGIFQPTI